MSAATSTSGPSRMARPRQAENNEKNTGEIYK
jgi:hypothetical protein